MWVQARPSLQSHSQYVHSSEEPSTPGNTMPNEHSTASPPPYGKCLAALASFVQNLSKSTTRWHCVPCFFGGKRGVQTSLLLTSPLFVLIQVGSGCFSEPDVLKLHPHLPEKGDNLTGTKIHNASKMSASCFLLSTMKLPQWETIKCFISCSVCVRRRHAPGCHRKKCSEIKHSRTLIPHALFPAKKKYICMKAPSQQANVFKCVHERYSCWALVWKQAYLGLCLNLKPVRVLVYSKSSSKGKAHELLLPHGALWSSSARSGPPLRALALASDKLLRSAESEKVRRIFSCLEVAGFGSERFGIFFLGIGVFRYFSVFFALQPWRLSQVSLRSCASPWLERRRTSKDPGLRVSLNHLFTRRMLHYVSWYAVTLHAELYLYV